MSNEKNLSVKIIKQQFIMMLNEKGGDLGEENNKRQSYYSSANN
jgi:hypothetical protein